MTYEQSKIWASDYLWQVIKAETNQDQINSIATDLVDESIFQGDEASFDAIVEAALHVKNELLKN